MPHCWKSHVAAHFTITTTTTTTTTTTKWRLIVQEEKSNSFGGVEFSSILEKTINFSMNPCLFPFSHSGLYDKKTAPSYGMPDVAILYLETYEPRYVISNNVAF